MDRVYAVVFIDFDDCYTLGVYTDPSDAMWALRNRIEDHTLFCGSEAEYRRQLEPYSLQCYLLNTPDFLVDDGWLYDAVYYNIFSQFESVAE